MYRINYLNRPVLITPDEVLAQISADNDVDVRHVLNNIIVAEERIIAPALGDEFYESFIDAKNRTVTTGNQAALLTQINASLVASGKSPIQASDIPVGTIINAIEFVEDEAMQRLWQRFLWKATAESVDMMCIVPTWLRHTTQGQQKNNPEVIGGNGVGSVSGDRKDIQYKLDVWLQDRITPLLGRMHDYICSKKKADATAYPLYTRKCECNDSGGVNVSRKTDIILNAYSEQHSCNDCKFGAITWL